MISRNGVRVDTQQLRDIQDLISKLADVNKQLAQPVHTVPLTQVIEAPVAEAQTADAASAQRLPFPPGDRAQQSRRRRRSKRGRA
jgi:hypothetical protein